MQPSSHKMPTKSWAFPSTKIGIEIGRSGLTRLKELSPSTVPISSPYLCTHRTPPGPPPLAVIRAHSRKKFGICMLQIKSRPSLGERATISSPQKRISVTDGCLMSPPVKLVVWPQRLLPTCSGSAQKLLNFGISQAFLLIRMGSAFMILWIGYGTSSTRSMLEMISLNWLSPSRSACGLIEIKYVWASQDKWEVRFSTKLVACSASSSLHIIAHYSTRMPWTLAGSHHPHRGTRSMWTPLSSTSSTLWGWVL